MDIIGWTMLIGLILLISSGIGAIATSNCLPCADEFEERALNGAAKIFTIISLVSGIFFVVASGYSH